MRQEMVTAAVAAGMVARLGAAVAMVAAAIAAEGRAVRWLTRVMPTGRVWGG